jgi:hypothetical protein
MPEITQAEGRMAEPSRRHPHSTGLPAPRYEEQGLPLLLRDLRRNST